MKALILCAALLLGGCAVMSPDNTAMPNAQVTYPGRVLFHGQDVAGLASYRDLWCDIQIDSTMPYERRVAVLVHELLHAAGLRWEGRTKGCYNYFSGRHDFNAPLCPSERKRLLKTMVRDVRVHSAQKHWAEVGAAIDILNAALVGHPHRFFLVTDL